MNYLSDNVRCTVNGQETKLAIVVADGHIVFFQRTLGSGVIDNIIKTGAGIAGMTMGAIVAPVALAGLATYAVIGKLNKPGLIATINKIKVKYKISDDEVFISDPGKCLVKLSGKFSLLNSTCAVFIDGDFIAGETRNKYTIKMSFGERPSAIEKIFSKGNFPVSFSPLHQD
jgi:hypothetical protein